MTVVDSRATHNSGTFLLIYRIRESFLLVVNMWRLLQMKLVTYSIGEKVVIMI